MEARLVVVGGNRPFEGDVDWAATCAVRALATLDIEGPYQVAGISMRAAPFLEGTCEVRVRTPSFPYTVGLAPSGRLRDLTRDGFMGGQIENPPDPGALARVERWLGSLVPAFPVRVSHDPAATTLFHFDPVIGGLPFVYRRAPELGYVFLLLGGELVSCMANEELPTFGPSSPKVTEKQAIESAKAVHESIFLPKAVALGMTTHERCYGPCGLGWALAEGASEAILAWKVSTRARVDRPMSTRHDRREVLIDATSGRRIETRCWVWGPG